MIGWWRQRRVCNSLLATIMCLNTTIMPYAMMYDSLVPCSTMFCSHFSSVVQQMFKRHLNTAYFPKESKGSWEGCSVPVENSKIRVDGTVAIKELVDHCISAVMYLFRPDLALQGELLNYRMNFISLLTTIKATHWEKKKCFLKPSQRVIGNDCWTCCDSKSYDIIVKTLKWCHF